MGTRHLIAIVVDGEYKLAQYGQWDGYPSGQGVGILAAMREVDPDTFRDKVRNLKYITDEQYRQLWVDIGVDPDEKYVDSTIADKFASNNPQLSRDCGSDIISIIGKTNGNILVRDSLSFASDSLFCEYAYVIDLDVNILEVYRGFVKEPHTGERFSNFEIEPKADYAGSTQYYPVKFVTAVDLFDLPCDKDFIDEVLNIENPDVSTTTIEFNEKGDDMTTKNLDATALVKLETNGFTPLKIEEIKTAKEAYAEIERLSKEAKRLISHAETVAEKFNLEFYFSVDYGMGGTYAPDWDESWESSDEDSDEEKTRNYKWHASSQSC